MTTAITMSNDFHGSTATLRPRAGRISADAWRRAMHKLCGISGCTCGGVRGSQVLAPTIHLQEQPDGSRRVVKVAS